MAELGSLPANLQRLRTLCRTHHKSRSLFMDDLLGKVQQLLGLEASGQIWLVEGLRGSHPYRGFELW